MLSTTTRRGFLATSAAAAAIPATAMAANVPPGLAQHAKASGILYGTAAANYQLIDTAFAPALKREAAILVPEYEMKRDKIEATRGKLDFSAVDRLLGYASANGMKMRGHPLVWHKANPGWLEEAVLSTRDDRLLTAYIAVVMQHYRGKLHSIDVVNEALVTSSSRPDGLRETFWLTAFGPSYIDQAYHAAHVTDPGATLVYNDWGCEMAGADNDRMRALTLDFLERALARKVPIHAYGMQAHLAAFDQPVDQRKLRTFLDALKAMGLKLIVTELDVYDLRETTNAATIDRAVADATTRFLDVALGYTDTVLTWGLSDKFLEQPTWRQRLRGYTPRMLPLDSTMQRKAMWRAMASTFDRAGASSALRGGQRP
ncbi:MAG TPA: endo-1,4-beta-xylanase [Rhizomicrobium sp.]|nr:endo-1,4-beta-xylanase [Rhizomicrobium sp.]